MSALPEGQLLLAAGQYLQSGHYSRAIATLTQLLQQDPHSFQAHSLLGIAYQASINHSAAIDHFRAALKLQSNWSEGFELLGRSEAAIGKHEQAVQAFTEAVRLRPDRAEARNNVGTVLRSLGRFGEAIEHLRQAVQLRPDQAEIHSNLAGALLDDGQTFEAVAGFERAIALQPRIAMFHQGLGHALLRLGKHSAAIDQFRTAITLDPAQHQTRSSLLLCLHYLDSANEDPQALFQEHLEFDRQHFRNAAPLLTERNVTASTRRLRVGYISADFRTHSVAAFIEPILSHHDRIRFEIFCYADVARGDQTTERLQSYASHWRSVIGRSDDQVAQQIAADQIDILVDLSGHSGGGRLGVFVRKPAPVQVTYLGYPDTTGLAAMDYRLSDSVADPPGESDRRCVEKLVRIDPTFLCFQPPDNAPEVSPPPCRQSGHITFGSFNNLAKISNGTISLWAGAMRAVPGSRLLVKSRGLQQPAAAELLIAGFAEQGIEADRLSFIGQDQSVRDHLARYGQVDIALDTFPYNGTTTTCEALWMGVPVITLAGRTHAARVGASILSSIGRERWVADCPDSYTKIAINLSRNLTQLTEERTALRANISSSPITNATAFTRQLESQLQRMYDRIQAIKLDSPAPNRL
jgi:predicted O-linked N-acetylglucosamine transferase (SPINDLY family)